jgi:hypothetical protein
MYLSIGGLTLVPGTVGIRKRVIKESTRFIKLDRCGFNHVIDTTLNKNGI